MREFGAVDRLQPALLDRLTDEDPTSTFEPRERRIMSMRQLKDSVKRDLLFLFNSHCKPKDDVIWKYPLAAQSVVNFGMPDMTGLPTSAQRSRQVRMSMQQAMENFEPRIVKSSLRVEATISNEDFAIGNLYVTQIAAEVCPVPVPEALYVRTEVDLDTGRIALKE